VILQEEPAEELRGAAIAAVDRCPMTALHITK
jgi:ferredoxin